MNNAQLFGSAALPGALPFSGSQSGAAYAFFGLPVIGPAAALSMVVNQIVFTPIFVPFSIRVSQLGVLLNNSSGGLYVGLYSIGSSGQIGSLIYDFGSTTASGLSAAASNPPTLQRGWYMLAVNAAGTTPTIYGYSPANCPAAVTSGLLSVNGASATTSPIPLNALAKTAGAFNSTLSGAPNASFASLQIAQMVTA